MMTTSPDELRKNLEKSVALNGIDETVTTQYRSRGSDILTSTSRESRVQSDSYEPTPSTLLEINQTIAENFQLYKVHAVTARTRKSASLLSIGGKDIGDSTRRIMAKLVSHELSLQYNWTGRGKKEFKSLRNVLRMILVCLRKNPFCRNATETEIASVIKLWLRTASDCQGGRNRRRTKPAEEGGDDTH
ncbi:uncharacterized protein isoform X2 [Leptinotarsa decemlineata]|uniref:uncharacterized protein isoform X2 n=1 Tax=Leptinotarsa decemlineata TaxID=7539 RepID=UPI003D30A47A